MREFKGGCHCGDIRYVFIWPADGDPPLRTCNCTFCVKHGGIYSSHPDGSLAVTFRGKDVAADYEFGTKSAHFHCCRRCGTFVFVVSRIEGRDRAVLNMRTVDDFKPPAQVQPLSYEGENLGDRLGRRDRNWIGTVTITVAG